VRDYIEYFFDCWDKAVLPEYDVNGRLWCFLRRVRRNRFSAKKI